MFVEKPVINSYKVGQVVWAKIIGYPWWPAEVRGPNSSQNRLCQFRLIWTNQLKSLLSAIAHSNLKSNL